MGKAVKLRRERLTIEPFIELRRLEIGGKQMHIESERMKNTRRSISIGQEQREGAYDCRQIGKLGGRVACPTGLQFLRG